MAGFECTYAKAENGRRLDLLAASKHDEYVLHDYQLLGDLDIRTVREGFSWWQIDRGDGRYHFDRFEPILRAGIESGVQQIWDLNHFDFPDRIDPFSDRFITTFAEYSRRVIGQVRRFIPGTIYIVPLNEPSFFSWMCNCGLWAPYRRGEGAVFKRQLVRAAIAAMDAIRQEDSDVRFIHVDPFMYRRPMRVTSPADREFCREFNEHIRFQAWDMISGRTCPELGGDPGYLDIVGINYYFHNQQLTRVVDGDEPKFKTLPLKHPDRLPLADLVGEVYARYRRPIVITETGSYRGRRPQWWRYVLGQVGNVLKGSLPVYGLCSYPTLDIERGAGFIFPRSGLWDFAPDDRSCRRVPHKETLRTIKEFAAGLNS